MNTLARGIARTLILTVCAATVLLFAWSALADPLLVRAAAPPIGDAGQFVTVDHVHTYFQVEGTGPPLLLIHGLGSSHLTWQSVQHRFASQFTVYSLDLPGFGYSDKPAGYASARLEAAFVDHFLGTLGVAPATVVGHSMGADVAMWLAIDHPERVARAVVVDAAEIGEAAAVFQLAATPIVGDLMLKTGTTPLSMHALMSDPYVQKEALTADLAAQYATFYWTPGARQALIDHARSYDADRAGLLARLSGISVPALVVWADGDPYFPVTVAEHLQNLLPGSTLRIIAGAGHLPQEEQPGAFSHVVLQWLPT
jgi:pimeloyl-ACP methyl ester carboxylesterase